MNAFNELTYDEMIAIDGGDTEGWARIALGVLTAAGGAVEVYSGVAAGDGAKNIVVGVCGIVMGIGMIFDND